MSRPGASSATPNGAHALGAFAKCERRYFYGQHLQLRPKGKSINLELGTGWHRALETYYWIYALREAPQAYPNRPSEVEALGARWDADPVEQAIEVCLSYVGHPPPESSEKVETAWAWARNWVPTAFRCYDEYCRQHDAGVAQVYLDAAKTLPAIEVYFEVPLGADIEPFTGRLDRVFNRSGLLAVQEHKTVQPQGAAFLERDARMNIQFSAYNPGCKSLFGRLPAFVELNAITKANTPEIYRRPITRTIEELIAVERLLDHVAAMVVERRNAAAQGLNVYWAPTGILNGYCVDYGSECPFLPLCKSPHIPLREWDLDTMYNVGKPLEEM